MGRGAKIWLVLLVVGCSLSAVAARPSVTILSVRCYLPWMPARSWRGRDIWGSASIKNVSDKILTHLVLRVDFVNGVGQIETSFDKPIPELRPGQVVSFDTPYFYDYSRAQIRARASVYRQGEKHALVSATSE